VFATAADIAAALPFSPRVSSHAPVRFNLPPPNCPAWGGRFLETDMNSQDYKEAMRQIRKQWGGPLPAQPPPFSGWWSGLCPDEQDFVRQVARWVFWAAVALVAAKLL